MKKLMIAAAIVCAAAMSHGAASTWNWAVGGAAAQQVFKDRASGTTLYSTTPTATVYLFAADTISQDELLAGLRDNTYASLADASSLANSGLTTDSKLKSPVTDGSISHGTAGNKYNFYMAAMDAAGNLFLSANVQGAAQENDSPTLSFTGVATATAKDWTSDATFKFDTADGGKGAGWYAVPEPTSGLLLLLGVAGLALRRRRA